MIGSEDGRHNGSVSVGITASSFAGNGISEPMVPNILLAINSSLQYKRALRNS
jgi:hypothetical protein